ncbi:penicillin-insensitive murein endopeptidase [Janthinobacterium kumbetense]|uniref:Penicillin-insensitive murein endopeptidase n=1 Tax=Janthinobacterium kumbetense TaxID=2950280 RepID=A0ABT0WR43_9BURK|nr:penicillin-insensitive murein endopeptidase [Janthinobacterium kumbetense]MCM2566453.1 penicillin-insensitive murein endopeptidase [Janthinobacterium kumbetense]
MLELQPRDARGYFNLSQRPEGAGYYTYGTPPNGAGQYAHPKLLSLLFLVEHQWQGIDSRKIGFGNISLADGVVYHDHASHRSGKDVDVRLFRKDKMERAVTRFDTQYDRDATAQLIRIFFEFSFVQVIYFNDPTIPRIRPLIHHDDHFHITIK